jgi:hypothetical protein
MAVEVFFHRKLRWKYCLGQSFTHASVGYAPKRGSVSNV